MICKNAWYRQKRGICTIISGLADIPRLTQTSHWYSANITSTIFNVQKRIFSLWNDNFAHVIVLTAHASVLDVTLMRIYEVAQNFKFHFKMLYLANICVYNSLTDDFEWYVKMADIAKNAVYIQSIRAWLTLHDCCIYHTVSVQISPPQYTKCKNAFSASETTILPKWLYSLRTPVYLMSLWCAYMKLRRIAIFHRKYFI